jgi:hypothetical protein
MTINSDNDAEIDNFITETLPVLNGQWVDHDGHTAMVCPECNCKPTFSGNDKIYPRKIKKY